MRNTAFKLLSSLVLIASIAIVAHMMAQISVLTIPAKAIEDTEGKSADQLLDESNGIVQGYADPKYPSSPQKSRAQWKSKSWTGLDAPMPSSLSGSSTSAKDSRSLSASKAEFQDESPTSVVDTTLLSSKISQERTLAKAEAEAEDMASNEASSDNSSSEVASPTSSSSISGSWSFEMEDNTRKEMALTLFQSKNEIFGTGTLAEGDSTLIVTAAGTKDSDNNLELFITSLGNITLYRLRLTADGNSVSGDYTGVSASGDQWTGSAVGTRSVPQDREL